MREAASKLADKEVTAAFTALQRKNRVEVIDDSIERLNTVADRVVKAERGKETLAIIETNAERKQLMRLSVRSSLTSTKFPVSPQP